MNQQNEAVVLESEEGIPLRISGRPSGVDQATLTTTATITAPKIIPIELFLFNFYHSD